MPGHPPTYAVREERILSALDAWLEVLTGPDAIDSTIAAVLEADHAAGAEPADVATARRRHQRLQSELDRILAAIRAGMDPALAARETRSIQDELSAVESTIQRWEREPDRIAPLTESAVRETLAGAGSLVHLLQRADRVDRAKLYQALGISLRYTKEAATGLEVIQARLELRSSGGRI